jgi:hypothetical protein
MLTQTKKAGGRRFTNIDLATKCFAVLAIEAATDAGMSVTAAYREVKSKFYRWIDSGCYQRPEFHSKPSDSISRFADAC